MSVFPNGSVEARFFHFAQANWRKVVDLGLRQLYINDETFSINVQMLTALGFLPPSKVSESFAEVKDNFPEEMCILVSHFKQTYVGFYNYASNAKDGKMVCISSSSSLFILLLFLFIFVADERSSLARELLKQCQTICK